MRLLTTNYVVDETATRLRYDVGLPAAMRFRDALLKAEVSRRTRIVWIDQATEAEAWRILQNHAAIGLSLTDATTIAVARASRIREVFGFDSDFRALGFVVAPGVPAKKARAAK